MTGCTQDTNEIISEIIKVGTVEEAQLWFRSCNSQAVSRVIEEIEVNWPSYAFCIVQTIMKFVPIFIAKLKKGELKTLDDLSLLIFEFIWSVAKPAIERWIESNKKVREVLEKLNYYLDENLERLIFLFIKHFQKRFKHNV